VLGVGAHVRCSGKGRKERCTPLTHHTAAVLHQWISELGDIGDQHPGHQSSYEARNWPLFPTRQRHPLNPDSIGDLIDRHVTTARTAYPGWTTNRVTPHTLRHTAAMRLLHAGTDVAVIALWLGHEHTQTTQIYLHGDLTIKEQALARTKPADTPPGRYQPPDSLLAFLEAL
jgi:site-specific recombinase XerD